MVLDRGCFFRRIVHTTNYEKKSRRLGHPTAGTLLEGLPGWITQAGDNWQGPGYWGHCPEIPNWTFGSAH